MGVEMRKAALGAITLYQMTLSPVFFRGMCRYYPSCSHYTYEAIQRYGVPKGAWLGVKRLSRCRPFGSSGYDPVP